MSIIPTVAESTARAFPASVYVFPALSVTLLIVGVVPNTDDHATTMRWPLAVAGMVQVVAG
ncbi:MAG: hypothetical protein IT166_17725 [Bryobacterales bacterium]|nr:hypothetical protein [Bryobacterales bacterium]